MADPPGATAGMTEKVNDDVRQYFQTQEKDNVDSVFTVMGFNFASRAQSAGLVIVSLKDYDQRPKASQSAQAITRRALVHFRNYSGAIVTPFLPPAVMALGNASGFDFELKDRGHLGHAALVAARISCSNLLPKIQGWSQCVRMVWRMRRR